MLTHIATLTLMPTNRPELLKYGFDIFFLFILVLYFSIHLPKNWVDLIMSVCSPVKTTKSEELLKLEAWD